MAELVKQNWKQVIEPHGKVFHLKLRELWQYRDLIKLFVRRDFVAQYKQTILGPAWHILNPLLTTIIFTIVFGRIANISTDGLPQFIFYMAGNVIWVYFAGVLTATSGTFITGASIFGKVYFPRLILPIAGVVIKFVDFLIGAVILVGLMIYYGFVPDSAIILVLPLLLLITFLAAIGGGLFLSAINVKYRDVRYVLPYFIQMLLFLTPVIYPTSIAGKWSFLLALNPMTGVIKASRASLFGNAPINWELLFISLISVFVLLIVGIIFFKKTERYFADVV